jgi:hypothetical protein
VQTKRTRKKYHHVLAAKKVKHLDGQELHHDAYKHSNHTLTLLIETLYFHVIESFWIGAVPE